MVNVYIGNLQDSQEEIIFYMEDYDTDDDSICLSGPPDESIMLFLNYGMPCPRKLKKFSRTLPRISLFLPQGVLPSS